MSQRTKVKSDSLGLYVIAGGWICRPFYNTIFTKGDEVKTHHFPGSTNAGVTFHSENFTKNGKYEMWSTTGVTVFEYKNKEENLKESYEFYKNLSLNFYKTFSELNEEFKNQFKK